MPNRSSARFSPSSERHFWLWRRLPLPWEAAGSAFTGWWPVNAPIHAPSPLNPNHQNLHRAQILRRWLSPFPRQVHHQTPGLERDGFTCVHPSRSKHSRNGASIGPSLPTSMQQRREQKQLRQPGRLGALLRRAASTPRRAQGRRASGLSMPPSGTLQYDIVTGGRSPFR